MRRVFVSITIWILIISAVQNKLACAESTKIRNPNLKYFGYYHSDLDFDKKTHRGYIADYTDEIGRLGNANIMMLNAWPGWYIKNPNKFYRNVKQASKYKMKVLLNVYEIFFQWKKGRMQENWQKRWAKYKKMIAPKIKEVFGFYIDEPKQTGIKEADFLLATKRMRDDFPDKEVITVLSVHSLVEKKLSASYLKYCTGVGFDYYEGSWKLTDKKKNPQKSYYALFEKLKTQIAPGKHLWIVTKTFRRVDFKSKNTPANDLIHWYRLAKREKRVVGILNFSFASYWADYNPIGAHYLFDENSPYYDKYLKKLHIRIGKAIIER